MSWSVNALIGGQWVLRRGIKIWVPDPTPIRLPEPDPVEAARELDAMASDIIQATADYFDVAAIDLIGQRFARDHAHCLARHVARWLLRRTGMKLTDIAGIFNRDHTSVINSIQRVDRDAEMRRIAECLERDLAAETRAAA